MHNIKKGPEWRQQSMIKKIPETGSNPEVNNGYTTSELGFDCIIVLLKAGTFTQNCLIATLN